MEKIINTFLYCIYLMDVKLHYLFNQINPARFLLYVPLIKNKWERKNQDPVKEYNKFYKNKVTGFSIWTAQGIVGIIIFLILIGSVFLISRVFNFYENVSEIYFAICVGISMVICYLYMLKHDKYLSYFDEFEKWTRIQKRKYVVISVLVILASIAYFFMSLMCC